MAARLTDLFFQSRIPVDRPACTTSRSHPLEYSSDGTAPRPFTLIPSRAQLLPPHTASGEFLFIHVNYLPLFTTKPYPLDSDSAPDHLNHIPTTLL